MSLVNDRKWGVKPDSITGNNKDALEVILTNRTSELKIKVIKNSFCDLKAPVAGEMSRIIKAIKQFCGINSFLP